MRAEFEAECFCKNTGRNEVGYFDPEVQMKWNVFQKGWKASSATQPVKLPIRAPYAPYRSEFENGCDTGFDECLDEVKSALDAAGISYE